MRCWVSPCSTPSATTRPPGTTAQGARGACPTMSDWRRMLAAVARQRRGRGRTCAVPPVTYFDRDALLAPPRRRGCPEPPDRGLRPQPLAPASSSRAATPSAASAAASSAGSPTRSARTTAVRCGPTGTASAPTPGILTLAYMREKLNSENLRSTYPPGAKIGFQPDGLEPPEGVTHFRTADGSWNNLDDPKEGAAGTRFPRNVANSTRSGRRATRSCCRPNPREISRSCSAEGRTDEGGAVPEPPGRVVDPVPEPRLDHPWREPAPEIIEIPLAEDDPARTESIARPTCSSAAPNPTRHARSPVRRPR